MVKEALAPYIKELEKNGLIQIKGAFFKNAYGQTLDAFYPAKDKQEIVFACAIGQIAYNMSTGVGSVIGELNMINDVTCPSKGCIKQRNLGDMIVHLNDIHRWKFRSIARWMKTL